MQRYSFSMALPSKLSIPCAPKKMGVYESVRGVYEYVRATHGFFYGVYGAVRGVFSVVRGVFSIFRFRTFFPFSTQRHCQHSLRYVPVLKCSKLDRGRSLPQHLHCMGPLLTRTPYPRSPDGGPPDN